MAIYIENNIALIEKENCYHIYTYVYDLMRSKFVWVCVDDCKSLEEGYRKSEKIKNIQLTQADYENGVENIE